MKNKFLKIDKPCNENWEDMTPDERGRFCNKCSKSVVDFTKLSQFEIASLMKESQDICVRVKKSQLELPLLDFETRTPTFPYFNIAAGLVAAVVFAGCKSKNIENHENAEYTKVEKAIKKTKCEITMMGEPVPVIKGKQKTLGFGKLETEIKQTETLQAADTVYNSKDRNVELSSKDKTVSKCTIINGKINSEGGKPVENAKVTFVTIKKVLSTYTDKEGDFCLEIPTELIDNDNVLRVTYSNSEYGFKDYIFTKEDIKSIYKIIAEPYCQFYSWNIQFSGEIPTVFDNGKEILYQDFVKAQKGEKSRLSLRNKYYFFFRDDAAAAICSMKGRTCLYIIFDDHEE